MTINRNIWSTSVYVYRATASGVAIHDTVTSSLLDFVTVSGGANSVWADDQYLYVASNSGLLRSSVSGSITLSSYKTYPNITNDATNYVHGAGDYVCITTASGVDRYKISTGGREYVNIADPYKCFQTSNGDYYYVVNGTSSTSLFSVYESGGGYEYSSTQDVLNGFSQINDLFVTEGTSIYDDANVIFLATISGAVLLEEKRGDEANLRKRIYLLET